METVLRYISEGTHEVEARLGWVLPNGRFEPDIGVEKFSKLLSHCAGSGWSQTPQVSSTDYFYEDGVRVTRGLDGKVTESVRKTKLYDQTAQRSTRPELSYRVSVSDEEPVQVDTNEVAAKRIRMKTRQSFSGGSLRYDFTVVVDNGETSYLVEVEVLSSQSDVARELYESVAQLLRVIN